MSLWIWIVGAVAIGGTIVSCGPSGSSSSVPAGAVRAISIEHLGPEDRPVSRLLLVSSDVDPLKEFKSLSEGATVFSAAPDELSAAAENIEQAATHDPATAESPALGSFEFKVIRRGGESAWSLSPLGSAPALVGVRDAITDASARDELDKRAELARAGR